MEKQKKSSMTILTGQSTDEEIHINDVGNVFLHKRHHVQLTKIDNSKIGRAMVYDQHLIDKLYYNKFLDASQHRVCDRYLGVISKSGAHPSGSSCWKEYLPSNSSSLKPVPRACILIKVQRTIKRECGGKKENKFWNLMTRNPATISTKGLSIVIDCSNALFNHYWNDHEPVSYFQEALTARSL